MKSTAIKLGGNEFSELEDTAAEPYGQSDVKYFHLFKNSACYEFALSVETTRSEDEELAQVDRGKVFQQLERILTTAKIKDVELPGVENAQKTTTPESASAAESKLTDATKAGSKNPLPDSKAEKAQVVTPTEQK
jgi:hypothetical protein